MSVTSKLDTVLERPGRTGRLLGLGFLLVIPLLFGSSDVTTWTVYLTFAILALAIDLVWGYTGLLTLGHAAFFGAGAYLTAKFLKNYAAVPDAVVVFVLAPLFCAALALAIGWFLFSANVTGPYFAITTLIVAVVFERIAGEFVDFLGGFNGLYNIPSLELVGFDVGTVPMYYLSLGVLVGFFLLAKTIVDSAFGRQLRGIRQDMERTAMFGYNTEWARLLVFTLSGGMAGVAGGMYATVNNFVSPPLLGFVLSTQVVIWIAVGGRGTLVGAVLGAILIQFLNSTLSDLFVNSWNIVLALVFIGFVLVGPRGLIGLIEDGIERLEFVGESTPAVSTSETDGGRRYE